MVKYNHYLCITENKKIGIPTTIIYKSEEHNITTYNRDQNKHYV